MRRFLRGLAAPVAIPLRLLVAGLPMFPSVGGRLSAWKEMVTGGDRGKGGKKDDKKGKKGKRT